MQAQPATSELVIPLLKDQNYTPELQCTPCKRIHSDVSGVFSRQEKLSFLKTLIGVIRILVTFQLCFVHLNRLIHQPWDLLVLFPSQRNVSSDKHIMKTNHKTSLFETVQHCLLTLQSCI